MNEYSSPIHGEALTKWMQGKGKTLKTFSEIKITSYDEKKESDISKIQGYVELADTFGFAYYHSPRITCHYLSL